MRTATGFRRRTRTERASDGILGLPPAATNPASYVSSDGKMFRRNSWSLSPSTKT
jgi:hypothetical protein